MSEKPREIDSFLEGVNEGLFIARGVLSRLDARQECCGLGGGDNPRECCGQPTTLIDLNNALDALKAITGKDDIRTMMVDALNAGTRLRRYFGKSINAGPLTKNPSREAALLRDFYEKIDSVTTALNPDLAPKEPQP